MFRVFTSSTIVSIFILSVGTPVIHGRTWTSTTGGSVEGEFVHLSGRTVLLKQGEQSIRLSYGQLSDEDRKWINDYRTLTKARVWKTTKGTEELGKYEDATAKELSIKRGAEIIKIPIADLTSEDKAHLDKIIALLGEDGAEGSTGLEPGGAEGERGIPQELSRGESVPMEQPLEARPIDPAYAPTLPATADQPERTWTGKNGKKLTARFVRIEGDHVILIKEWRVPLTSLSPEDTAYVQQLAGGIAGVPMEIPVEQQAPPSAVIADGPFASIPQEPTPGENPFLQTYNFPDRTSFTLSMTENPQAGQWIYFWLTPTSGPSPVLHAWYRIVLEGLEPGPWQPLLTTPEVYALTGSELTGSPESMAFARGTAEQLTPGNYQFQARIFSPQNNVYYDLKGFTLPLGEQPVATGETPLPAEPK